MRGIGGGGQIKRERGRERKREREKKRQREREKRGGRIEGGIETTMVRERSEIETKTETF